MKYRINFCIKVGIMLLAIFQILEWRAYCTEIFFVTQSGAGSHTGLSLANAWSASEFNTAGNWNTSDVVGKIDGGDMVYFNGTITTDLTVQASGTSGNNIVFDGTNATLNSHFYAGGTNASPRTARQYLTFQNITFASGRTGDYPCMGFYGSSYITIKNVKAQNVSGAYPLDLTGASYTTVDGLNLDGLNNYGIRLNRAHHVTLSRLQIVTATTVQAAQKDIIVTYGGNNITLEESYIHHRLVGVTPNVDKNDIWETYCQSLDCVSGDYPHHNIARYNLLVMEMASGTVNHNFLIWGASTGGDAVYGNVFVLKGTNHSSEFIAYTWAGYDSTLDVYNNTFVAIENYPIYAFGIHNVNGATTVNLKNNIFYNALSSGTAVCSKADKWSACGTGTATINHSHNTWSGFASSSWNTQTCANWIGTGEKCNANPLFADSANEEFSLQEGSIARNAGISLRSEYEQQIMPGAKWPNPTLISPSILSIGAYGSDARIPMSPTFVSIR